MDLQKNKAPSPKGSRVGVKGNRVALAMFLAIARRSLSSLYGPIADYSHFPLRVIGLGFTFLMRVAVDE